MGLRWTTGPVDLAPFQLYRIKPPSSWTEPTWKLSSKPLNQLNGNGTQHGSPSSQDSTSPTWYHSVLPPSPIIPSPTSPPRDPSLPNLAAEFVNAGRRGKKQGRLENHLGIFKLRTTNTRVQCPSSYFISQDCKGCFPSMLASCKINRIPVSPDASSLCFRNLVSNTIVAGYHPQSPKSTEVSEVHRWNAKRSHRDFWYSSWHWLILNHFGDS